jgi:hypothetical protein
MSPATLATYSAAAVVSIPDDEHHRLHYLHPVKSPNPATHGHLREWRRTAPVAVRRTPMRL